MDNQKPTSAVDRGRQDPFFEVIPDTHWNACIGRQGAAENYVDGYLEAALELVAAVIDKNLVASRDTLAMPILYNCRHALELSLKFAIERLHSAGLLAGKHAINHDILSHWQHLHDANVGDAQLKNIIAELQPYVASLAQIDDDGQELRYARNREGGRSLESFALVNLRHVRASIEAMSRILQRLKLRIYDIEDERATGSHTAECSRTDLEDIARMIGDRSTWADPTFNERKAAVMERFGLVSNKKFSAAVDVIRSSRPLAAIVGIEHDLKHLSDEKAVTVLKLWAQAHPPRQHDPNDLGMDYFNRDWDKVNEHMRMSRALDDAVVALLTAEELSDLEVLYYLGRDRVHGEHYDSKLAVTVKEHRLSDSLSDGVHHLMAKTNLLDSVIAGAAAAGRPSLAVKLREIRHVAGASLGG